MRTSYFISVLAIALGLSGCARHDTDRRGEPAARQAGREAYQAGQTIKREAKEAAKELRKAGKNFRDGWSEARREDPKRSDK